MLDSVTSRGKTRHSDHQRPGAALRWRRTMVSHEGFTRGFHTRVSHEGCTRGLRTIGARAQPCTWDGAMIGEAVIVTTGRFMAGFGPDVRLFL